MITKTTVGATTRAMIRRALALCLVVVAITACGDDATANRPTGDEMIVTGELSYDQSPEPPPASTATVTLSNISRADAPAVIIAEETIALDGSDQPVAFSLSVPGAELEPGERYSVRAVINDGEGALLHTTDTTNPVDPQASSPVDLGRLQLVAVQPSEASGDGHPIHGEWAVAEIAGEPTIAGKQPTIAFDSNGTLSGSTGCNSFTTQYSIDGADLTLGVIATTRRACVPELGDQETRFLKALEESTGYEIIGSIATLILEGSDGATITADR